MPNMTLWSRAILEEADSHSAGKEIPSFLRYTNVHYLVHKNPPLDPILSQMNPFYLITCFFRFHINIILPATSTSPKLPLPFSFLQSKVRMHFYHPHTYYMSCPSHSPRLITLIIFGEEYKSRVVAGSKE
jgi:hypothetical protein